MTAEWHISSFIVHCKPDAFQAVCDAIEHMNDSDTCAPEICATDPAGKLILVFETSDRKSLLNYIDQICSLEGVINASMVYHQSETEPAEHESGELS